MPWVTTIDKKEYMWVNLKIITLREARHKRETHTSKYHDSIYIKFNKILENAN